jgi:hypothetical protein
MVNTVDYLVAEKLTTSTRSWRLVAEIENVEVACDSIKQMTDAGRSPAPPTNKY